MSGRVPLSIVCVVFAIVAVLAEPSLGVAEYAFLDNIGLSGVGSSDFNNPTRVQVLSDESFVVSDQNGTHKFDSSGGYVTSVPSHGRLAVDAWDNVYVTTIYPPYPVLKFGSDLGTETVLPISLDTWANGIAVCPNGDVVVSMGKSTVERYSQDGALIAEWGSFGREPGQFRTPEGVAVDAAGNILVVDSNNHRVQIFSGDGELLTLFGSEGGGPGEFFEPRSVAVDRFGRVYVSDRLGSVQKFTSWGAYLCEPADFLEPWGVAVGPNGTVLVCDIRNDRVRRYRPLRDEVAGSVVDALTGAPVEGIHVRMVSASDPLPGDSREASTTVTAADGSFSFGMVEGGYYSLSLIDMADRYRDTHIPLSGLRLEYAPIHRVVGGTPLAGLTGYAMPSSTIPDRVGRLAGPNRYETSARISRAWSEAETVVIASGLSFPDALSAAPLAGYYDAPILLVGGESLARATSKEIRRLGATTAIVVGGTGAVSVGVEKDLRGLGCRITRLAGSNRYETSRRIVSHLRSVAGSSLHALPVVVRGDSFADALSASPFAARYLHPVLLVEPNSAPQPTIRSISDLGASTAIVVGSESAVGIGALEDLANGVAGGRLGYYRVAGSDRYTTSKAVVEAWGPAFDTYGLATGADFPDALSGGAYLGRHGGALLLTSPETLSGSAASLLRRDRRYTLWVDVFGGGSAVSPSVVSASARVLGTDVYDMNSILTMSPGSTLAFGAIPETAAHVSHAAGFSGRGAGEGRVEAPVEE